MSTTLASDLDPVQLAGRSATDDSVPAAVEVEPYGTGRGSIEIYVAAAGEVLLSEKRSDTIMSATSSVTQLGNSLVSQTSVVSDIVLTHDFWIRTTEAREVPIRITGIDVPLRQGQDVILVCISHKSRVRNAVLVNKSAQAWYRLEKKSSVRVILLGLSSGTIRRLASTFLLTVLLGNLTERILHKQLAPIVTIYVIGTIVFIWHLISGNRQVSVAEARLESALDDFCVELI